MLITPVVIRIHHPLESSAGIDSSGDDRIQPNTPKISTPR
jgi:hypothetical protein